MVCEDKDTAVAVEFCVGRDRLLGRVGTSTYTAIALFFDIYAQDQNLRGLWRITRMCCNRQRTEGAERKGERTTIGQVRRAKLANENAVASSCVRRTLSLIPYTPMGSAVSPS